MRTDRISIQIVWHNALKIAMKRPILFIDLFIFTMTPVVMTPVLFFINAICCQGLCFTWYYFDCKLNGDSLN